MPMQGRAQWEEADDRVPRDLREGQPRLLCIRSLHHPTGKTLEETERSIEEAIDLYIDTFSRRGRLSPNVPPRPGLSPPPNSRSLYVSRPAWYNGGGRDHSMPRTTAKPRKATDEKTRQKRSPLPPKGTAARLMRSAGLWSHMTDEEIEHIKQEILSSRRSSE